MNRSYRLLAGCQLGTLSLLVGLFGTGPCMADGPKQSDPRLCFPRLAPRSFQSAHAQLRQQEGRKTGTAYNDAVTASVHSTYLQWDGRWIVRGPKGREHVFEPNGQHVTTVDSRTDQAHLRLVRKGDRRLVTGDELLRFQALLVKITVR